jgi:nitrate reductase gamma subunit
MGALISLIAVVGLVLAALFAVGVGDLRFLVGVVVPGIAFAVFLAGILYRVVRWARAPVPFRIPTTCGQEKSLPWVKNEELDNPSGALGVIGRLLLEVLFFRSLFRNHVVEVLPDKQKVNYLDTKYLWAAAMAFHWAMLVVVLRHFRFFVEPVPQWVEKLQLVDGFFQVGVPVIYGTTVLFVVAGGYLLLRRLADAKVRFISLPLDIVQVKAAIAGWTSLQPVVPAGVGLMYFVHVSLVSVLLVYFPFSKLLHMPGVFLSPTRNLANSNRTKRHVNPWNPHVNVHTYPEWEEEFHDKLVAAGYPLDKE